MRDVSKDVLEGLLGLWDSEEEFILYLSLAVEDQRIDSSQAYHITEYWITT